MKRLIRVNDCGEAVGGRVAPDSEITYSRCDNCRDINPFIKMVGVVRKYILWMPMKAVGEEFEYWQCNRFVYYQRPSIST